MKRFKQATRTRVASDLRRLVFGLVAFCSIFSLSAVLAQNSLLSYRGEVRSGTNRFNGNAWIKFALVNQTNVIVWSSAELDPNSAEPRAGVRVAIRDGLFGVCLGDTNLQNMGILPAAVFAQPELRLRIWLDDGTNGSVMMTPDQRLTSVPNALAADFLTRPISADKILGSISPQNIADASITSSMLAPGSIGSAQLQANILSTNHIDSSLRAWIENKSGDVINVRNYGVVGNGIADDSGAIQQCIDLESGKRNSFYFPAGNYRLTKPIQIRRENTRNLGDGPDRTFFRQTGINEHGLTLQPGSGNYGGAGAMWNTYLEGFCITGPGRTNTTASGIHLVHPSSPGTYFADMFKLTRVRVGNSWTTGFKCGITITNCVSIVAELCEFKFCTEAVRLAKCDSAWFVQCQTGYTGTDAFLSWRNDPETVCFNILDGGLGTHILGGEHGHMYRFANIHSGSVVNVYGGNFESFADSAYRIIDSHVCISNPRMALASADVPIFRIASGAPKVVVLTGNYGSAKTVFVMETAGDLPNYIGAPVRGTNSASGTSFSLPTGSTVPQ